MSLHYKKDGSLDMRYSSSRAAANASSGSSSGASASPRIAGNISTSRFVGASASPVVSPDLHIKKDGSLDMRYASSKQAMASGGCTGSPGTPNTTPMDSGLHRKKDGTPDMRYASSKQALASSSGFTANSSGKPNTSLNESDLHRKKDGSLDMRYASSKQAMSSGGYTRSPRAPNTRPMDSGLHLKKDGSLDMRYASSKQAVALGGLEARMASMRVSPAGGHGIPASVPTKKDGTPDMRTGAGKAWVAEQARLHGNSPPSWVPRLKDGTIDVSSPVGRMYKDAVPRQSATETESQSLESLLDDQQRRVDYWQRRWEESVQFNEQFLSQMMIDVPAPEPSQPPSQSASSASSQLDLEEIDASELKIVAEIGRGGFGTVQKAEWRGRCVAVKWLHVDRLTRDAKKSFRRELDVARTLNLFQHTNLVATLAYCLEPPIIVMELLTLGSLAFVLHFSEEAEVEAKICDGRIKRQLAYGVACGVEQLHAVAICHRDLKPHNVLVADDWTAKVGDFGLSELRGFASANASSSPGRCDPAGTAAYMAPELLDSDEPSSFKADVYSFGVLLNELLAEEQPYSGRANYFDGRGPFGAVNYARLGNRPSLARGVADHVSSLIQRCWDAQPESRPTFREVVQAIEDPQFVVPNGGGLRG